MRAVGFHKSFMRGLIGLSTGFLCLRVSTPGHFEGFSRFDRVV